MCEEQVTQGGDGLYNLKRALRLCKDLATQYDKIRAKYWEHMADTIKKKADGTYDPATDNSCFMSEEN